MEIKHPSPRDLGLAAVLICIFSAVHIAGYQLGMLSAEQVRLGSGFAAVGALLAASGVSLSKHGWRAAIVYLVVGLVLTAATA